MPGFAAAGAARLPRTGVLDRGSAEVEEEILIPEGTLVAGTVRASDESSIVEGYPLCFAVVQRRTREEEQTDRSRPRARAAAAPESETAHSSKK